jgi:hypothetical protein
MYHAVSYLVAYLGLLSHLLSYLVSQGEDALCLPHTMKACLEVSTSVRIRGTGSRVQISARKSAIQIEVFLSSCRRVPR